MPPKRITCAQCGTVVYRKSEQPFCSRECFRLSRPNVWSDAEIASLTALYKAHEGAIVPLAEWAEAHGRTASKAQHKAYKLGITQPDRPRHLPRKIKLPKWSTDEDRKAALSRATRERLATVGHPRGALGLKHTAESKAKMGQASTQMWKSMTQEQLAALVAKRNRTNIERYGTGGPVHVQSEQPFSRCKGGKRPDLDNRYFRSAWEANYARYLNFLVECGQIKRWEYEPQTFVFHGVTRGALTYTPDFIVISLDDSECYHEVKGWMTSQSKTRMKRMAKHYPEVSIRLVDEPVYRTLNRQCRGLIAGWE